MKTGAKEDRTAKENPISLTAPTIDRVGIVGMTRNVSPKNQLPTTSQPGQINHSVNNSTSGTTSQHKGLANGAQIAKAARSRLKGMQNSHSNKKLPTWKGNSLLADGGNLERGGIADRSLDRMHGNLLSGGAAVVLQSRQELMQNEYKKIIENHPATIGTGT